MKMRRCFRIIQVYSVIKSETKSAMSLERSLVFFGNSIVLVCHPLCVRQTGRSLSFYRSSIQASNGHARTRFVQLNSTMESVEYCWDIGIKSVWYQANKTQHVIHFWFWCFFYNTTHKHGV